MDDLVDIEDVSSDNEDNDVIYEKLTKGEPLNDPNCVHDTIVKDKTEELGDTYMCKACGLGWIYEKVDSPS